MNIGIVYYYIRPKSYLIKWSIDGSYIELKPQLKAIKCRILLLLFQVYLF
jgi:hypothetical protein